MQRLLIFFTIVFVAHVSRAQSPYWQPVNGAFENVPSISKPDSVIITKIGANYYSYDAAHGTWRSYDYQPPQQITWPRDQYKNIMVAVTFRNDTAYFSNLDSVYFTSDFGVTWKNLGSFGPSGRYAIAQIFELPNGLTIIQNSYGTLYYSYNAFTTFDSTHLPGVITNYDYPNLLRLQNNVDTLFFSDKVGSLYRSSDIGKHWDTLQFVTDTASNPFSLSFNPDAYVMTNRLAYSRDGGRTFVRMNRPADTLLNRIEFGGDRFYGYFYSSPTDHFYRSDDWGQTWKRIAYYPSIIEKNGVLYYGIERSSDYGETWQAMTAKGLIGVPVSMEAWNNQTFLAVDQGVYFLNDTTSSWDNVSSSSGILGHGYGGALTLNTINVLRGPFKRMVAFNLNKPSFSAITETGYIWISDNGKLSESYDSGASFFAFTLDKGQDLKNVFPLTGDTVLAIYAHGVWKASDLVTGTAVTLPTSAKLTGATAKDSIGVFYLGVADGTVLVSYDHASTWQIFPTPASTPGKIVTSLAAGAGILWAVVADTVTKATSVFRYDSIGKSWTDISSGITGDVTPNITNVWYVNHYAYAGTSNMGLFRSVKSTQAAVHTSKEQSEVSISPNPVSRMLAVSYDNGVGGSVSILDVTGREVIRAPIQSDRSEMAMDVSALPSGMYVVRIVTPRMTRSVKFVKE